MVNEAIKRIRRTPTLKSFVKVLMIYIDHLDRCNSLKQACKGCLSQSYCINKAVTGHFTNGSCAHCPCRGYTKQDCNCGFDRVKPLLDTIFKGA